MSSPRLDPAVRARVMERDGYRCAHCGHRADTIQHRANKQSGGSRHRDNPANLMAMCLAFNVSAEAHTPDAQLARAKGWKLAQHDDPTAVPVWDIVDETHYMLDDDYGRHPVAQPWVDVLNELAELARKGRTNAKHETT